MKRLKNIYTGRDALMIFGGPSIVENQLPLERVDRARYTVFLESKALTPYFIKAGLMPDFYLMFYLEKCKSNAFQHVVFQSFLADMDLTGLIRDEYQDEYQFLKENFRMFFEAFRPERGVHKRFRYKTEVFLRDSPLDLLSRFPETACLAFRDNFLAYRESFHVANPVYTCGIGPADAEFDLGDYFTLDESGDIPRVKDYSFLNSASIALFPVLNFLGFRTVFFLGMDMSMLGSMEYAACYTFKSLAHYRKFFKKARRAFSGNFKENKRPFMRPPHEFAALEKILKYQGMNFVNIYEPFEYSLPVDGIPNISFKEFLNGAR